MMNDEFGYRVDTEHDTQLIYHKNPNLSYSTARGHRDKCTHPDLFAFVKLSPVSRVITVNCLCERGTGFHPSFDALGQGKRLDLSVAFFSKIICKPARTSRSSAAA